MMRTLTDEEFRRRFETCPSADVAFECARRFIGNESDAERIEELEDENDRLENEATGELQEERDRANDLEVENNTLTEENAELAIANSDLCKQVDALTAAFAAYIT